MSEGTEDKLAIYKMQANTASKKKENALAELKKTEEEVRVDLKEYMEQLKKIVCNHLIKKIPLEGTDYVISDIIAIEHKMFSK